MSMANGTVMPLMCIVFGEMTDSFISSESSKYNLTGLSGFLLIKAHSEQDPWLSNDLTTSCCLLDITLPVMNVTLQEDMQRYG